MSYSPLRFPRSLALRRLRVAAVIAGAAVSFGFLLPAGVAARSGVLFGETMISRLPPEAQRQLRSRDSQELSLRGALDRVNSRLIDRASGISNNNPETTTALLALRDAYQTELRQRPPISVQPLMYHILMFFWPFMYLCLGLLVTVLKPGRTSATNGDRTSLVAVASSIFLMSTFPLIVRNIALRSTRMGRVVYAYSNLDVDPASFAVQLINFAIFSVLLARLWLDWIGASTPNAESEPAHSRSWFDATVAPSRLEALSTLVLHWQVSFAVLSAAFMLYTAVFWRQLVRAGDLRFLPEAIIVHALWLISALIMAAPFWTAWRAWQSDRVRATAEIARADPSSSIDFSLKLSVIRDLRPVGSWNVAAFGLTLFSSAVVPIVQLLFR